MFFIVRIWFDVSFTHAYAGAGFYPTHTTVGVNY
jgi:hypothetical protein